MQPRRQMISGESAFGERCYRSAFVMPPQNSVIPAQAGITNVGRSSTARTLDVPPMPIAPDSAPSLSLFGAPAQPAPGDLRVTLNSALPPLCGGRAELGVYAKVSDCGDGTPSAGGSLCLLSFGATGGLFCAFGEGALDIWRDIRGLAACFTMVDVHRTDFAGGRQHRAP